MTKSDFVPTKVHLVGSVGLDSTEEVFHTAGSLLGGALRGFPMVNRGGGEASGLAGSIRFYWPIQA